MQERQKRATAFQLYSEGFYVWKIAEILKTTEAKVVAWLSLE